MRSRELAEPSIDDGGSVSGASSYSHASQESAERNEVSDLKVLQPLAHVFTASGSLQVWPQGHPQQLARGELLTCIQRVVI
jgi:hypothetical protein